VFAPFASLILRDGLARLLSSIRQRVLGRAWPVVEFPARPIVLASVFSWCGAQPAPANQRAY